MSIIIGLTGPTGAGKSSVSGIAQTLGFKVIDCDKFARTAVEKGTAGLAALVKAFGNDILTPDGSLDRKVLAQAAFCSADKTELLNKTLLPHIAKLIKQEINTEFVLLDAPTLFESGLQGICTVTVAVLASRQSRKDRIMHRDNIESAAAELRMHAGKPDEFYIKNADKVFYNNGDITEFQKNIKEYLKNIIGGK